MGPLDGLRVVDLSPLRAGVQASQLLADFGAEVIWIEPPGGAPLREHVSFPMWGRGKQSLELNLHQPADVQRLRQLVATADVLIESFRPGVMERLGLSYESLAPLNPRLVYASITGFGRHGPYAGIKAYEGVVMAKLGVFGAFNRLTDTPGPPFVTTQYASFSASQTALHGILAALFEREHSGLGQRVDTSMAMGFAALDTWQWFMHLVTSRWPGAFAPAAVFDENGSPVGPYPFMLLIALTSDGHWLQFAQVAPHLYKALMTALGLEWMYEDPKWKGIPFLDDSDKREELWANMLAAARKLSLAQWEEIFESNTDVFAEVFRDGPNVLDHPQLVHDGHVMELVDPDRGPVRQPAGILQMDGTPLTIDRPAPRVGEHHPDLDLDALPEPPMSKVADGPRRLPLEGITIVELAVQYAAPYGATLLTDLGARVLKIEALEGDPIRNMMPMPESSGAKVMQGKESVTVDLGSPEGVAIVQQLAAKADVVLQGFRAGVVKRLGLDSETLQALNPKLVYVNAPGYGIGPPNGHRPAFAPSIAAAGGMARANVGNAVPESSELDTEQVRRGSRVLSAGGTVTNAQADGFAALAVATAILTGLVARERGAGGQTVLTSMLSSVSHAMSDQVITYPGAPAAPRADAGLHGLSALYRIYAAADGGVFLAAPVESEWKSLVDALAPYANLASDSRFASESDRHANDEVLIDVLGAIFEQRAALEWERDLLAVDVACVAIPTQTTEEIFWSDEVGRASGYVVDVHHPTFDDHPRLAPTVQFSRSLTQAKPGVLAGSANDAVLTELGFDAEAIADLRARKIIG